MGRFHTVEDSRKRADGNLNSLSTVIKGSAVVLVGAVVGYGLNFVMKMLLARHFGPHNYGLLSMAFAVIVITANIATMGLNMGIARFIALLEGNKQYDQIKKAIVSGGKVVGILGIFSGVVVFILAPRISNMLGDNGDLAFLIYFCAIVIPFSVMLNYSVGILRGYKDMRGMAVCRDIVNLTIRVSLVVVIILAGCSIKLVPIAYLISVVIALFLSLIFIKRKEVSRAQVPIGASDSGFRLRELVTFSIPLSLSTVTNMFRKRFDILLVGFFLPASEVGLYSAALPIAMLLTIFLFAINRILMPVASDLLGRGNEEEMISVYKTAARWSVMMGLPVCFVILLFSEVVLAMFFGAEYVQAAAVLRILSMGALFNAASGSFGEYLQAYGKTGYILWISVTGTVMNLLLMILTIPKYGIIGAGISSAASLIWMCLLGMYLLYKWRLVVPFTKEYFRVFIIGSLILVNMAWFYVLPVGLRSSTSLLFIIVAIGCLYFLGLYHSGAINEEDRILAAELRKRIT